MAGPDNTYSLFGETDADIVIYKDYVLQRTDEEGTAEARKFGKDLYEQASAARKNVIHVRSAFNRRSTMLKLCYMLTVQRFSNVPLLFKSYVRFFSHLFICSSNKIYHIKSFVNYHPMYEKQQVEYHLNLFS